jgi:mannosyltransferase
LTRKTQRDRGAAGAGGERARPVNARQPHQRAVSRAGRRLERAEWACALLLTGVVLALHCTFARHAGGLWRDEANSINLATLPSLREIWSHGEFDSFPILWFLILRGWSSLGLLSDGALRLLGFMVGTATLGAYWLQARGVARSLPLVTLVLLGLSPDQIRWGDSMRAYGLGTCLLLIAFERFWAATRSPSRKNVALAGVAAVLSVQCLFQNAVLLVPLVAASVAVFVRRRSWKEVLLPIGLGAAAALSLLPYIPMIARARSWNMIIQVHFTPALLLHNVGDMLAAPGRWMIYVWLATAAAAGAAAIATMRRATTSEAPQAEVVLFCTVAAATSVVAFPLFLAALSYLTESWYYLSWAALVAACVEADLAAGAGGAARRWFRVLAVAAVAALVVPNAWRALQPAQTNLDLVASRLNAEATEGDLVVINPWYFGISFERYYRASAECLTVPPLGRLRLHRFDRLREEMFDPEAMAPVLAAMTTALRSGHTLWLVGKLPAASSQRPPPHVPPPPLPETGWSVAPYQRAWEIETDVFLRRHAAAAQAVPVPRDAQPYEDPSVARIEGWRD